MFPFRDYVEKNMAENDDNKDRILSTLGDIETSGCDVLLQQLFVQLKVRHQRVGFNGQESGEMSLCHPNLWQTQFRRALGQVTPQHHS